MLDFRIRRGWILALLCVSSGAFAIESSDTLEQLREEISVLRNEVAALRAEKNGDWLSERHAEMVRQLIAEILADADQRTSLLGETITAGHDGKFFIARADNAFRLNIFGTIQARYIINSRDDSGEDDFESGFTLRRVELGFSGHIGTPKKMTYFVNYATSRDTEMVNLQDFILGLQLNDGWTLYGGRTKLPVMREEIISSNMQQAIERSVVNYVFSPEYGEGVGLKYTGETYRFAAMFSDGAKSGSVGGVGNDFYHDRADYAVSVRLQRKLAGEWKQIKDFQAWRNEPTSSVLGVALHYEAGESGDSGSSGVDDRTLVWTADGSLERDGLSLYAAVMGKHIANDGALGDSRDHYGLVTQAGYMVVADKLEPFARFEWIAADVDAGEEDRLRLVTVGVNYFIHKDRVKFTVDLVWALDPILAVNTLGVGGPTGTGLLTDAAGEDNQIAARAQFQFKY